MNESDLVVKISGDASGAVSALNQTGEAMQSMANSVVNHIAAMVAGFLGLEKAIEGVKAGINFADQMRDMANSLNVFAGSVAQGQQALHFFAEQAERTRNTTLELSAAFRDILPVGQARGFGNDAMEQITVMLSQLATMRGVSLDAMEMGFRRLLSGSPMIARNPLMAALGFTKENVDLTWKEFTEALIAKTSNFDQFGQSFESTMHKVKDAWKEAFGEGFNEAMGGGRQAFDNLRSDITNPQFLEGLRTIGSAFANIVVGVSNLVAGLGELKNTPPPAWMQRFADSLMGVGSDRSGGLIATNVLLGGTGFETTGEEGNLTTAPAGMIAAGTIAALSNQYKSAIGPTLDLNAALRENAENLGKVAIAAKKASDAQKALAEETKAFVAQMTMFGSFEAQTKKFGMEGQFGPAQPFELPMIDRQITARWLGLLTADPAIDEAARQKAKRDGEILGRAIQQAMLDDQFLGDFSGAMFGIFKEGGKGFAAELERDFNRLIKQGSETFTKQLFGTPEIDKATGQPTGRMTGGIFGPEGARVGGIALAGAESFISGFQNKQAGRGSELSSVLQGAAAGNSVWPGWGALIGGVLGFIGYQFGNAPDRPGISATIDATGVAAVAGNAALTAPMLEQMRQQVQTVYDQIHDAMLSVILKFPDIALPKPAAFFGTVDDKFHEFASNFQQWLMGSLPKALMTAFTTELTSGFEQLGMSAEKFQEIFAHLQTIDPSKAVALLGQLADALTQFGPSGKAYQFFHANVAPDITGTLGSASFQQGLMDISLRGTMTPGQLLKEQDDAIIKFAASIKEFSPEKQIEMEAQLGQMMTQRYDTEKRAIQAIYDIVKSITAVVGNAEDQLRLQGMVTPEGKPDLVRQSAFFRDKAQKDLLRIAAARTPEEANAALNAYVQDIMQSEQLGVQAGGSPVDWSKWGISQLETGQAIAKKTLDALGATINATNDIFNKQFDPILKGLTVTVRNIDTILDPIADPNGPIGEIPHRFRVLSDSTGALTDAFDAAVARINRAAVGASSSSFRIQTAVARVS